MRSAIHVLAVGGATGDDDCAASALDSIDDAFTVAHVATPGAALDRLAADGTAFDCLLVDRDVSGPAARELLGTVDERSPDLASVVVVDEAATAVDAVEAGATDALRWPSGADAATLLARRVRNAVVASRTDSDDLTPAESAAVFESVDCGVSIVDLVDDEFRYHRCNARMAELAGVRVEDIEGETPTGAFGADHGRELEARYRECLERGEPVTYTLVADLSTGGAVEEGYVRPVDGPGDRLVAVVQEVTGRREQAAELRASKRRLRALFERSPDMINVHDAEGRIVEVNPQMCEMTGHDEATLKEMSVWDLDRSADPDRARALWSEMSPGDRVRTEGEFECADGSTFPVEVHVRCLGDGDAERFVAISRDVTEQRSRERELQRKNDRLEEFASVVSHDLRNPLQVLRGALDGAAETGDVAHFERGHRAIDRMEEMIADVLALARQGDTVDELDTVSLRETVEGCWENVRTDDATLVVETSARIRASEIRLRQLVENLLRNAVEHGGQGVTVEVGTLSDGFYVADDGRGIPEDVRHRVFESGYSTTPSGTGFGLAIVEGVVDAHGWTVTLTESDDSGARFEFEGVGVVS